MGNKGSKIHPIQEVQNPLGYSTSCTLITSKKIKYYVHTYDPTTPLLLLRKRLSSELISERFVDSRRENCCNVISISLYFIGCIPDNMTKYLFSIERTVKNVHNNLPGWIVRVYFDNSVHECIKTADKKRSRQITDAYNYITTAQMLKYIHTIVLFAMMTNRDILREQELIGFFHFPMKM